MCPQHKPAGKGPRPPSPGSGPAPPESDEFGSFLYWRPPLPSIEEELRELLVRILWSLLPVLALRFLAGLSRPLCASLTVFSPPMAQAISGSPEPPEEHRSSADGASAGEEEEDEESDDEGWITPSNLKQAQQDTGHCDTAPVGVQVGCVTTDFAMQVGAGLQPGLKPRGCSHQGSAESLGRGEQLWDSSVGQTSRVSVPEACAKPVGLSAPSGRAQSHLPAFPAPGSQFFSALAERAAADGSPRAGRERDADPPGPELHPALPRLLQVLGLILLPG